MVCFTPAGLLRYFTIVTHLRREVDCAGHTPGVISVGRYYRAQRSEAKALIEFGLCTRRTNTYAAKGLIEDRPTIRGGRYFSFRARYGRQVRGASFLG